MYAAAGGEAEMVEMLLSKGADVTPRSLYSDWPSQITSEPRTQYRSVGGLTALLYAARAGCAGCVVQLIAAGADVDRTTPEGITPLMIALDNSHNYVAQLLMERGANTHTWDWWGRTALWIAVDRIPVAPGWVGFRGLAEVAGAVKPGVDPLVRSPSGRKARRPRYPAWRSSTPSSMPARIPSGS